MDDRELNQLLREWKAPDAPPHLRPPQPLSPADDQSLRKGGWWVWLLTGSIRIPVPVGIAVALLASFWLYTSASKPTPTPEAAPSSQPVVSLADFEPVAEVEVRSVGDMK